MLGASYYAAWRAPYGIAVMDGFLSDVGVDFDANATALSDEELQRAKEQLQYWDEKDRTERETIETKVICLFCFVLFFFFFFLLLLLL